LSIVFIMCWLSILYWFLYLYLLKSRTR